MKVPKTTRGKFLAASAAVGAALSLPYAPFILPREVGAVGARPRVMINSVNVTNLRNRIASDAQLAADVGRLVAQKTSLIAEPLASAAASWNKSAVDSNENTTVSLALLYVIDPVAHLDAGNRAVARVVDMCAHTKTADWTPQSWLNMGSSAFAVAVGFDWCYDRFTTTQLASVLSGAKTRGIDPYNAHTSSQAPYDMWHDYNWAGQINGGVGCLIRSLWGETSYQGVLDTAWANWESRVQKGTFWTDYGGTRYWVPLALSGGQKEGGYLDYYMEKLVAVFATYLAETGMDHPFWATWSPLAVNAAHFLRHKAGPPDNQNASGHNGEPLQLRFSDGSERWMSDEEASWTGFVGRRMQDAYVKGVLQESRGWATGGSSNVTVDGVTGAMRLLFYSDAGIDPIANSEPRDAYYEDTAIWTARSSWTDSDAIYVGGRVGGDVDEGHTHIDRGSPLLFGHGVEYLVDAGEDKREGAGGDVYDNFFTPAEESANRWRFPRLRASGHSCLVINPNNQTDQRTGRQNASYAYPVIEKHAEEVASPYVVMNLTPQYSGRSPWTKVTKVKRGWKFDSRNKLIVQDEITCASADKVYSLFQVRKPNSTTSPITFQQVNGQQKVAIIAAPGADNRRCYCRILGPSNAVFAKRPYGALPGTTYLYSGADIQSNATLETLYVLLSGSSNYTLSIMFMPLAHGQADPATFPSVVPLNNW